MINKNGKGNPTTIINSNRKTKINSPSISNNIMKQYFTENKRGVSAFDQYASNKNINDNNQHTNLNISDEYLFTPPPTPPHKVTYVNNDDYSLTSPKSNNNVKIHNQNNVINSGYEYNEYDPASPELNNFINIDFHPYQYEKTNYNKWKLRQESLIKWASIFAKRYYLKNEPQNTKYDTWVEMEWTKWKNDFILKTKNNKLSLDRHHILSSMDPNYINFIENDLIKKKNLF